MVKIEDITTEKIKKNEKRNLIKNLAEKFFGYAEINFGMISIYTNGKEIGHLFPNSDGIRLWEKGYEDEVSEFGKIYEEKIMGLNKKDSLQGNSTREFVITTDYSLE